MTIARTDATEPVKSHDVDRRRDIHDPRFEDEPCEVPAWMSVAEARAVLVNAGLRSLPVADHYGLIGLITIEALAGGGQPAPAPDTPIVSVMDWHLVQVSPDADEATTVHEFTRAAWTWLYRRQGDRTGGASMDRGATVPTQEVTP